LNQFEIIVTKINVLWLFYKRLILPALLLAFLSGLFFMTFAMRFSSTAVGIAYLFFACLFHYFIYEIRHSYEYYFYYNLGLSKLHLWINTIVTSWLVCIIICLL